MTVHDRIDRSTGHVPSDAPTTARDLRRAGVGALVAAGVIAVLPLAILVLAPLTGTVWLDPPEMYDPATTASWAAGLWGLVECATVIGVAVLWIGVRRASPAGWWRDLGSVAGLVWVVGLALHAALFMVKDTPAQAANWEALSSDVSVRAAIGAGVMVVTWGCWALAIVGAAGWTVALVAGGRRAGIVGLGSGIPALVVAAAAMALAVTGIIPPAATFAQLVLLALVGIALLVRARRLRRGIPLRRRTAEAY